MDVENSANGETATYNSHSHHVNGINGYSSSTSPDKHKSRKSEHKDKHRDKDKDRNRSNHKSSKDKDKDRHSSSSKDKEREKDKDRHSSSHKSSSRDKDKEKEKEKHRHKDEKKSSSSSSSKDKERSSSSSSKRDKDKDKHKDRHSSSSKDKDKDKEKERHSSSKDKHRHSSSKDKDRKERKEKSNHRSSEEAHIKRVSQNHIQDDSMDEDDNKLVIKETEDVNVSAASSCDYSLSQFKGDEPRFQADEEVEEEEDVEVEERREENIDKSSPGKVAVKQEAEDDSEEDVPLSARLSSTSKRKFVSDDEDDVPLSIKKIKREKKEAKKKKNKRQLSDEEEEEEEEEEEIMKPPKKEKKIKKEKSGRKSSSTATPTPSQENGTGTSSPKKKGQKRIKKEVEEAEVWKWWEEEKKSDGSKWKFLEHKGPVFAPVYEPLPTTVKFSYNGKEMRLTPKTEEVAGFYAKMLDHDYTTKKIFNDNFFKDWRSVMTSKEKETITSLDKCNFKYMHAFFMDLAEKNRNRTKEEKLALKEKNEEILKEYGFCTIDGHKEKIGNFKIEPPGLFRGRGEHPKMGKLKRRVEAEHIIINCSKDSKIPQPPEGHRWKDVKHDNSVTWLASWTENVQNQVKYIMLNPSSKLKGEKDWQKYETARKLHKCIDKIRSEYKNDWKSKEMRIRQRAVALYFIDKLALRAGNEKDEDQADTVGCCSLRVEHIELHEQKDDKEFVVVFDFLGKDSIRYYNEVSVEKRVFKNLQLFMENKAGSDDLFDRLNTTIMNKHLNELVEGLTAKVFRTYNASWTLQQQLDLLTSADDTVAEKILSYNRANRAVAILCNHQRAVPKSHEKSMEKLKEKIDAKRDIIKDAAKQVKEAHREARNGSVKEKLNYEKKKKTLERLKEQLSKLEIQETDRDENKTIALGTSKLNYLDPRISVAWCKKYEVPIEKIYNKTQRDKFRWAIDMAGPEYRF